MPLAWKALADLKDAAAFTIRDASQWLQRRATGWDEYWNTGGKLPVGGPDQAMAAAGANPLEVYALLIDGALLRPYGIGQFEVAVAAHLQVRFELVFRQPLEAARGVRRASTTRCTTRRRTRLNS